MGILGTHNNNSFENDYEPDTIENDYTEVEVLENEIELLNRLLNESNERTRFMKSKFQEIAKICDLRHFQHGTLDINQVRKIEAIVEPYLK